MECKIKVDSNEKNHNVCMKNNNKSTSVFGYNDDHMVEILRIKADTIGNRK